MRFAIESAVPASWRSCEHGNSDECMSSKEAPLGVHAPHRYLTGLRFTTLAAVCPEILQLFNLQSAAVTHSENVSVQAPLIENEEKSESLASSEIPEQDSTGRGLGWVSRCSFSGKELPCVAAVYGSADEPWAVAHSASSTSRSLEATLSNMSVVGARQEEPSPAPDSGLGWGCSSNDYAPIHRESSSFGPVAALAARGGCSFRQKAQAAQVEGFSALVIVLGGDLLMPPDLGVCTASSPADDCAVRILVVAVVQAPAAMLATAVSGLYVPVGSLDVALEDGDYLALRGNSREQGALLDTSGLWSVVHTLLNQSLSTSNKDTNGKHSEVFNEGAAHSNTEGALFESRDQMVEAAAAVAKQLTPLSFQALRERIGDVVVDCDHGCPRSITRLARVAANLPSFVVVSVPNDYLDAFATRALPLLRSPVVLHTGGEIIYKH